MGYSFYIEYKSTKIFGKADGLSHLPVEPNTDYSKINVIELVIATSGETERITS